VHSRSDVRGIALAAVLAACAGTPPVEAPRPASEEEITSLEGARLVAVDLSEPSKEVIEASLALAQSLDASVELVHVREPYIYAVAGDYGPSLEQEQALVRGADRTMVRLLLESLFAQQGVRTSFSEKEAAKRLRAV